ncbi:hypothetical protein CEY12_06115 [Chryseobacterium sp. T16E-39]|uniref:hypothetical protein n=1 Tax=Chryseobacterium sp. T16E-39 TaxID=2015076 RepID=UPI000B5B4748|nr:hypothetical protein [Chryseobacterium sp. T16E-39]ASK29703.1 hypothetical protein CEY12_06115 [Chryseobacterium sp. T16E-39]
MEKLISMTDFVLQFEKPVGYFEDQSDFLHCQVEYMQNVMNYAKFLKQPLTLGMFVPCDEECNVLSEPILGREPFSNNEEDFSNWERHRKKYIEAKEKVLFDGFEIGSLNTVFNVELGLTIYLDNCQFSIEDSLGIGGGDLMGKTIEALAYAPLEIKLTPSTLKQIGL